MEQKQTLSNVIELVIQTNNNTDEQSLEQFHEEDDLYYYKRAQWLRAVVLGANDGLACTTSLMIGVGALSHDVKAMMLAGFAGLVIGACTIAIGEFVSYHYQFNTEVVEMRYVERLEDEEGMRPSPLRAAAILALVFSAGAMVPLLVATFIQDYSLGLGVVEGATSMSLAVFGWFGAFLGRTPALRAAVRVLLCGWVAMCITFGSLMSA